MSHKRDTNLYSPGTQTRTVPSPKKYPDSSSNLSTNPDTFWDTKASPDFYQTSAQRDAALAAASGGEHMNRLSHSKAPPQEAPSARFSNAIQRHSQSMLSCSPRASLPRRDCRTAWCRREAQRGAAKRQRAEAGECRLGLRREAACVTGRRRRPGIAKRRRGVCILVLPAPPSPNRMLARVQRAIVFFRARISSAGVRGLSRFWVEFMQFGSLPTNPCRRKSH